MELIYKATIALLSFSILVIAFTGSDYWTTDNNSPEIQKHYVMDPNHPDGELIQVNGIMPSYKYDFPKINGADFSKEAITKALFRNIGTGNDLVVALLYERLAYLEAKDDNNNNARKAYERALILYQDTNQRVRAAELLSDLAHLEAKARNYASAVEYYHKSANIFRALNDSVRYDFTLKVAARLPSR